MEKLIYMKTLYRKWISKKLQKLREGTKCSQDDISANIEIKRATYAAYEEGRAEPSIYILQRICTFYKLSVDKFLEDSPLIMDC